MRPDSTPAFTLSRPAAECLVTELVSTADRKAYRIDPDFRTVLACLRRLADPDREGTAKLIYLARRFFLGVPPPDADCLFSAFVSGNDVKEPEGPPLLDFERDAGVLYASFRQQYGVDLLRASLHWYEFRELLAGLTEATPFGARVRLRALDESRVAPEDRPAVRRMKEQVAILPRVGRAEQALLDELDRRLAVGENPADVLVKLKEV